MNIGIINTALLTLLVIFALWAVMERSLLKAAIALALVSVVLTMIMFRLSSPLAAVFELSVCAGLITALFISVISLTDRLKTEEIIPAAKRHLKKYIYLPIILIVAGTLLYYFVKLNLPFDFILPRPFLEEDVRIVFWNFRLSDLLGQIMVLLAGVFGVVALLKEVRK